MQFWRLAFGALVLALLLPDSGQAQEGNKKKGSLIGSWFETKTKNLIRFYEGGGFVDYSQEDSSALWVAEADANTSYLRIAGTTFRTAPKMADLGAGAVCRYKFESGRDREAQRGNGLIISGPCPYQGDYIRVEVALKSPIIGTWFNKNRGSMVEFSFGGHYVVHGPIIQERMVVNDKEFAIEFAIRYHLIARDSISRIVLPGEWMIAGDDDKGWIGIVKGGFPRSIQMCEYVIAKHKNVQREKSREIVTENYALTLFKCNDAGDDEVLTKVSVTERALRPGSSKPHCRSTSVDAPSILKCAHLPLCSRFERRIVRTSICNLRM